jgi:hypothetical protein
MGNPKYKLKSTASFTTYEFVSEGPKGRIRKLVKYTEYGDTGAFNLGFGDKLGKSNRFDDKVISGNGDSKKVLATVAATLYEFTNKYPNAIIFATGSSLARTRLYRIGISNALDDINKDFDVRGYLDDKWETFERNRDYSIFFITRKLIKNEKN